MVDVGCEFEDSVFEEFRVRKAVQKSESDSYKARFCEPEWFWDDISTLDDVKKLTALKFRGDLAFKRQDYQKALCEYTSSLALVADTNIALRRDLQEARARCLSYLGRDEDALDIAQELRSEVTNTDHLTTVLNLNIQIHHNAGNLKQELCCLQQLISLHPLNPWYWKKLAEAYFGLTQGLSLPTAPAVPDCEDKHGLRTSQQSAREAESSKTGPDCVRLQGVSSRSPMSETCARQSACPASVSTEEVSVLMLTSSRKPLEPVNSSSSCSIIATDTESKIGGELQHLWLFAYASFVRARLLLQMMKPQQTSFVLERSQVVQEEISQRLSGLYQSEDLLNALTKTMGKDLLPEKVKNGADAEGCAAFASSSALSSVNIESGSDFEERWFKKTRSFSIPR